MSLREYSFLKISLNLYIRFILALGCKKKVCKIEQAASNIFFTYCLGKCLTYCLSEAKVSREL